LKLPRYAALAAVVVSGALALTACGSNNSTGTSGTSSSSGSSSLSGTLNGEGSTAQQNSIEQAISTFGDANPNVTVNYNPTGSGAGVTQFNAGQVDFAGSDSALSTTPAAGSTTTEVAAAQKRCDGNPAWNLPMSIGPIAVAYNLPGVTKLILTPSVTAQIFLGKITTWNDKAIAAINPGVTLPSTKISVFFRSDQSGTTQNFETYLNTAAPSDFSATPSKVWAGKVGAGKAKSSGTSQAVKSTTGGITYVEWSYATDSKLGVAEIDNGGGPVALTAASASAAILAATASGTGNDLRLKLDYATKAAGTYPIVLATYEIVCSKGLAADKTTLLKAFLNSFASTTTQNSLVSIGYAPLPAAIQTKVVAAINAIS
jgi:phosphate transport system substrate-binding protein